MKTSIILFSLLFIITSLLFIAPVRAQKVKLEIDNDQLKESRITFDLIISNNKEDKLLVYKPDESDINSNIISIQLISKNGHSHSVFRSPIVDLDAIKLSWTNSVVLSKGDRFSRIFKFNLDEFSPSLSSGEYTMKVWLNYKDVNFISNQKNVRVFQKDVSATSSELLVIE